MSYILDALKRADAERERERGAVPGLNAQPLGLDDEDDQPLAPLPPPMSPWRWVAIGVAITAVGLGVAWLLRPGRDAAAPVTLAQAPSGVPVETLPSAAPAPMPAPALMPAPAPTLAPAPAPAPPAPAPAPAPAVSFPEATRPARAQPNASADAAKPAPAPVAPAAADAAEPRIHRVSELPESVRRELPALTLGGAMYSPKPASRMLIVNGQVFHEGDKLGPDLALRQIRLKEAVLEFKGYRYAVTY